MGQNVTMTAGMTKKRKILLINMNLNLGPILSESDPSLKLFI